MSRQLRILYVTSEMAPLLSTGGLAEVAAALPRALHDRGHDVRVAMPCYRQVPERHRGDPYCLSVADMNGETLYGALRVSSVPDSTIPLYLIEHEGYFGRESPYGLGAYEYDDNAERFCFFCLALLHGIPQTGWMPDVIHCNDWHTAPIPIFLKTRLREDPHWRGMPTLFTIHNLAYQGRYDAAQYARTGLAPELFTPEYVEYQGDMNLMKGALALADKLSTVSPRYAREVQTIEYGAGLNGLLNARRNDLYGILNGMDYGVWNPATDTHIAANYDTKDLRGKDACKGALQEMFGLPRCKAPLFGMVSRLHWQKGIDLVAGALEVLLKRDLQLVVLGTGDPTIEAELEAAATRHPDKIGVCLGFDAGRAHAVQAGSDFLIMPSRYEPCGLTQLYAQAYGTLPIVRRTGGLADTVRSVGAANSDATGISFVPLTTQAVARSVETALRLYRDKTLLRRLRLNGMNEDFSWGRSCDQYVALYQLAMGKA